MGNRSTIFVTGGHLLISQESVVSNVTSSARVELAQWHTVASARDLLLNLLKAELTAHYKTPMLGMVWFLLNPLMLATVLVTVFQRFIHLPIRGYAIFVLVALLPWTFFQMGVQNAAVAVTRSQALVKRVRIPRVLLTLSTVLASLVHFLVSLLLLLIVLAVMGKLPAVKGLVALPLLALLELLVVAGLGMAASAANVIYRDVEHFVATALRFGFWITPIFYPMSYVPLRWRGLYGLNPMALLMENYRAAILRSELPPLADVAQLTATAIAFVAAGMAVFVRLEPKMDDYV